MYILNKLNCDGNGKLVSVIRVMQSNRLSVYCHENGETYMCEPEELQMLTSKLEHDIIACISLLQELLSNNDSPVIDDRVNIAKINRVRKSMNDILRKYKYY